MSTTLKYEKRGLSVPLNRASVIELPAQLFRVRLRGALFDTDKAFLLPGAMAGIRGLVHIYGKHPNMSLVVTGHADRVGAADYNLGLSDERAAAVAMYLRDDVDGWMRWYAWRPYSKTWGLLEEQHMLGAIPDPSRGLPYYLGPAHGQLDLATHAALKRFQAAHSLSETGMPNTDTRRALIADYMGLDATSLPAEADVGLLGCGEHHNEIETADHVDEQANRRVEVFLFDGGEVEPPVPDRCPDADCPYLTWRDEMEHTIDFDTNLGELVVGVVEDDEHDEHAPDVVPIAEAQVRLLRDGFPTRHLITPPSGVVRFGDIVPGTYTLATHKQDFEESNEVVEVVEGGSAPPDLHDDVHVQGFDGSGDSSGSKLFEGVGGAAPTGGGNKAHKVALKSRTIIHIVEELPSNLEAAGKEGVARSGRKAFERMRVLATWGTSPAVTHEFVVDTQGKTVIANTKVPKKLGKLSAVQHEGPHLAPLIYTLRDASTDAIVTAPPIKRGKTTEVKVSARGRVSIWAFGAPLIKAMFKKVKKGTTFVAVKKVVLDPDQLNAMKDARLDDLTLNYCMAPPASNWGINNGSDVKDTKVAFSARLGPGGITQSSHTPAQEVAENDQVRDDYVREVVKELHARGIQVILSYTVGTDGKPKLPKNPTPKQLEAYKKALAAYPVTEKFNQEYADWLFAMTDRQIEEHAKAIDDFRERYDADGIGFNLEFHQIKEKHRHKLRHLVRTTAKYAQLRNAVVAYATAPFTVDGERTAGGPLHHSLTSLSILSFELAKTEKNLIARPMCFDETPFKTSHIEASLEYALKPTAQGGAGLDSAQIQYGVFGSFNPRAGFPASEYGPARIKKLCQEKLRPNRQGMMVYSLPQKRAPALAELARVVGWEAELNPGEVGPGTKGQPVQVPRWMDVT
ncbi:MAG: peptidoglycan-binding protein [Nannocystales bacterium]